MCVSLVRLIQSAKRERSNYMCAPHLTLIRSLDGFAIWYPIFPETCSSRVCVCAWERELSASFGFVPNSAHIGLESGSWYQFEQFKFGLIFRMDVCVVADWKCCCVCWVWSLLLDLMAFWVCCCCCCFHTLKFGTRFVSFHRICATIGVRLLHAMEFWTLCVYFLWPWTYEISFCIWVDIGAVSITFPSRTVCTCFCWLFAWLVGSTAFIHSLHAQYITILGSQP